MTDPSPEVKRLAQTAALDSVDFLEMSIVRNESPSEPFEAEGRMLMDIQVADANLDGDRAFRYVMTVVVRNHEGEVKVRPVATYHVPTEAAELLNDGSVAIEYGNRVAAMTLLPFAREAIATLSTRVFAEQILMPIFAASQIQFAPQDPDVNEDPLDDKPSGHEAS